MSYEFVDPDEWDEDDVYYDSQFGDYAHIRFPGDGEVELVNPHTGEVFHTYETEEEFDDDADHLHPVSREVVRDPVDAVYDALATATEMNIDSIDLQYARDATEIVERNADE